MANIVKVQEAGEGISALETIVECGHLIRGACAHCIIKAFDEVVLGATEQGKYMALNNLSAEELTEQDLANIQFNIDWVKSNITA